MAKRGVNNSGCGNVIATAILYFVGLVAIGSALFFLVSKLYDFVVGVINAIALVLNNFRVGLELCIPLIALLFIGGVIAMIVFYNTHHKPLSYEQVEKLAHWRARKFAKSNYKYTKTSIASNPEFKSSLDSTGRWYSINQPIASFPSLIADLLKGKHHEWVIIALEKDGVVFKMWANKGDDNKSVSFGCDINEVIKMCKREKGYSILRFHNHPNPDPSKYTTLLASDQDIISAKSCSEIVCKDGLNWFDFVCARGDYILFFSRISDSFEIQGSTVSDLVDLCGITPDMDYCLQKEYFRLNFKGVTGVTVAIAVLVMFLLFTIVGSVVNSGSLNGGADDTESVVPIEEVTEKWQTDGIVDYSDITEFEQAVNNNEDVVGKTVTFTVLEVKPNSILGYNIYAGEHLNFVSEEDIGINEGDEITVIVTGVKCIVSNHYEISYILLDKNGG